jgi:hypothetical protein
LFELSAQPLARLKRRAHARQQHRPRNRLAQVIEGTRLERTHARRDIAVSGQKNDRQQDLAFRQGSQQLHPVHARQRHVDDSARALLWAIRREEVLGRGEAAHRHARLGEQGGELIAYLRIVVNDDDRCLPGDRRLTLVRRVHALPPASATAVRLAIDPAPG